MVTEAMTEHLYRASVNGVSFELAIPGSTTSINGEPTEGAYVSISPSSAIRNAAADISLVYSSGEEDAPAIKSVENLKSHERSEVEGTAAFRIVGNNITVAADDESLTVVAADGSEAVAEVTGEDGYGMFITARLVAALPPGKGKVVLKTHGKRTPEGELRVLSKSVTILAGDTPPGPVPTITDARSEGLEADHVVADGETVTYVMGENLDSGKSGAEVVVEDGDGNRVGHGTGWWSEASNSLEVTLEHDADPVTAMGTIKVTVEAGTAEHGVWFD